MTIRSGAAVAAARPVIRLDVIDPDGTVVPHYSGNLSAANGAATKLIPFAANDKSGTWTMRAIDLLSGQKAIMQLEVDRSF